MSTGPLTVTQYKDRFISAQTSLLASPIAPSAAFREANEESDEGLDPRQLTLVVTALEGLITDHCRRIYAPQANRALAEQISDSYSKEADRKLQPDEDESQSIGKEVDLVSAMSIEALPRQWSLEKEGTAHPMEAKRYADNVENLIALNNQRKEVKMRVERLRRMKATIDPLQAEDAEQGLQGLQQNLVNRNGPVEKELEKLRTLLVRVAGRVGSLQDVPTAERDSKDVKPLSELRKRNIDVFLADSKVFPSK